MITEAPSTTHLQNQLHLLKTHTKANDLLARVHTQMAAGIETGAIEIPDHETELRVVRKADKEEPEDSEKKLTEILEKKQHMKKELWAIQQQEEMLKKSKITLGPAAETQSKYFKSELTPEDIERLKKLKAEEKKFEKELELKTKQYEQRMQKIKEQEEEARKLERKEKFEKKKQQIEKMIELIEKRRADRLARKQEENRAVKEIAAKKRLHEEWTQRWKAIEEEQERKKEDLKEELRKMKQVTHQEIKEHERKYNQAMRNQRESRLRRSIISTGVQQYKSVFLQQIKQQQERIKSEQEMKKNIPKQYLSKMKQYGEKVKTQHKPTIKQKPADAKENKGNSDESRSLSLFETHAKGNEYMRAVNKEIAQVFKNKEPNLSIKKEVEKPVKYKNYLNEIKSSTETNLKTLEMDNIGKIMRKQNLTQEEKLSQARLMAERIEHRKAARSNKAMVDSINAKIEILRQMEL